MRRLFVVGLVLVPFLGGCLLKQSKPDALTEASKYPKAKGIVSIEEVVGDGAAGVVVGRFAKAIPKARVLFQDFAEPEEFRLVHFPLRDFKRGPTCEVLKLKSAREEAEENRAAAGLISVGKLSFGPALQPTFTPVEEDANHKYTRRLDVGIGAGVYSFRAEGSPDVRAFEGILSMPDQVSGIQVLTREDSGTEDSSLQANTVKKAKPLRVVWKAPPIENAANIALLDVYSPGADAIYQVHCQAMEGDLGVGSVRGWEVPTKFLSYLPASHQAQLFAARVHVKDLKRADLDIQFQGFRTQFMKVAVE